MTLQASGAISMANINTELSLGSTSSISLNDTAVRNLLGRSTNASTISLNDAYGKSGYTSTVATGGQTIVVSGGYKYHVFGSAGIFTVSTVGTLSTIELLLVGGGGGGAGKRGGGGGGGGVTYVSTTMITGSFNVTIGAGGPCAPTSDIWGGSSAGDGVSSTIYQGSTLIASGGGGGGAGFFNYPGRNGLASNGNGGGSGSSDGYSAAPGSGVGLGSRGGRGGYGANAGGGGGGGAGGQGADGGAGAGGIGTNGYQVWAAATNTGHDVGGGNRYFGGGGGGGAGSFTAGGAGGWGGGAGGGTIDPNKPSFHVIDAMQNVGGGGGGGSDSAAFFGGNGGSGVVIIRYRYP